MGERATAGSDTGALPAPDALVPRAPPIDKAARARSAQRPLLLAVAVMVLVAGALTAMTLAYLRDEVLDNGVRVTESFAHVLEEQTSRTLQTVDQRLQLAASSLMRLEAMNQATPEQARALLRDQMAELPYVRAIRVLGPDGEARFSTQEDAPGPAQSPSGREFIRRHQPPNADFQIGPPQREPATQAWSFSASRALRRARGGAITGVIVASIDLRYLDRLWSGIAVGSGGAITLFGRDGLLLMRSPVDDALIGQRIPNLEIFSPRRWSTSIGSFTQVSSLDGVERIFAYRALSVQPSLTLVVGRSTSLVLAPWRRLAVVATLVWAAGALAVAVLCVFLARSWKHHLASELDAHRMAQRLVLATGSANVGVWDWDLKADQWYATPTYFTMLGHAPRMGASSSADSLENVHPEDKERVAGIIKAALESSDASYGYEARLGHADGGWRWVRVAGRVMERDEFGRATRLFGGNIDITQRKHAELELERAKDYAERLISTANAMVIGLDLEGRVTLFNHAAEIVSGYSFDEIRGRSIFDTLVPRDRYPAIWAGFQRVAQGGMRRTSEGPLVTRSGSMRTIAWRNSEMVEDGRITGVISYGIDMTERLEAEQDLQLADTELRVLNRTLRVMIECDQALVHATGETALLEEMCRIIVRSGGYRMAWVGMALHDEARSVQVAAVHGAGTRLHEYRLHWRDEDVGRGPVGQAIRGAQPVLVRDIELDRTLDVWQDAFRRLGVRSSIALPLGNTVPALGVLNIYAGELNRFHAEETRLLSDLAKNMTYGIQSLRVEARHREAELALAESEQRYRKLSDTSPYAIGLLQERKLILVNPACVALFGARNANELLGRDVAELVHPDFLRPALLRFGTSIGGAATLGPYESRYRRLDGSFIEVEASLTSFTYRDQPVVQVIATDITRRKQAEAELLESRALLRTLGRRVLAAQETERRRVAHELHDELGQSLTAIKINLQSRQRLGTQGTPELAAENMRLVEDALQQVRRLALALRPSVLDDLGLVPALRWMAEQSAQRSEMRVNFRADMPQQRLSPDIETACFRIAQEALTNIARYARASHVEVALRRVGEELELVVRDDGIGFDVAAVRARALAGTSIGVLGMQERASLIGATLAIESSPGHGSTVRLRCPWAEAV